MRFSLRHRWSGAKGGVDGRQSGAGGLLAPRYREVDVPGGEGANPGQPRTDFDVRRSGGHPVASEHSEGEGELAPETFRSVVAVAQTLRKGG
jgi:hypothetical protein